MADDMGEKTEQPTSKRLSEARQRGQVAKSQDMTGALMMIGATLMLLIFGERMFMGMANLVAYHLSTERLGASLTVGMTRGDMMTTGMEVVRIVLPVMLIMSFVGVMAIVLQIGLMLSGKALEPKLSKLNPIQGAKKLFSKRSVVRASLDFLKFVALAGTGLFMIRMNLDDLVMLTALHPAQGIVETAWLVIEVGAAVLLVLLLLALVDYFYQKWQHNEDLKMTKHEVKDERKSMEGDPEVRKRRAKIAQDIQGQRVQRDVPTADVVVTNPTHFSVALKYDAAAMGAPVVVAKGGDYLALRIRQIAAAEGIPIVERPPLARALYAGCEVGDEVPESWYEAVAEVLAFVYELEGRVLEGAGA